MLLGVFEERAPIVWSEVRPGRLGLLYFDDAGAVSGLYCQPVTGTSDVSTRAVGPTLALQIVLDRKLSLVADSRGVLDG